MLRTGFGAGGRSEGFGFGDAGEDAVEGEGALVGEVAWAAGATLISKKLVAINVEAMRQPYTLLFFIILSATIG